MNEGEIQKLEERLVQATSDTVTKVVNGKIDRLHNEVIEANRKQDEKLDEVRKIAVETKDNVRDVIDFYGTSSKFFRGMILLSKFVIAVGGAVGMVWGLFKYMVSSAIPSQ